MHQFNPIDAALLFMESPHTPFHVTMVNVYDPSTCPRKAPTFEDIVEAVRVSLPIAPSFRRKIVRVPLDIDYPYWVEDEHFDLEYHIRHLALPKPGNWAQFRTQVSRLMSRPLDLSRPPWEMTVIEGLDSFNDLPPGCFATVLKIHHCAIDGQAGVALFNEIHQDSPRKKPKKYEDIWQPEPLPGNKELLKNAWVNSIRRPLAIGRLVLSNASGLVQAALADLRSDDDDDDLVVPKTILNAPVSAHRIFDDVRCSLDDLKLVRRTVEGATINDVCLTIVAEGMRRYLDSKGKLPKAALVASVPIATRTPEQAKAGGNQISMTRVSLRTDIEDPLKRLAAISAETNRKKAMQDGVVMTTILDVVYNLPGALVGLAARVAPLAAASSAPISNTMVTNVPGPLQSMYFLGAKHIHATGCAPLMDGGGVLHAVTSYHGEFLFSFTACRDLLHDSDFYRDCLDGAVRDIIKLASRQKPDREKSASQRPRRKRKPRATAASAAAKKRVQASGVTII